MWYFYKHIYHYSFRPIELKQKEKKYVLKKNKDKLSIGAKQLKNKERERERKKERKKERKIERTNQKDIMTKKKLDR